MLRSVLNYYFNFKKTEAPNFVVPSQTFKFPGLKMRAVPWQNGVSASGTAGPGLNPAKV
jgi:hypothetical protein